jgi:deferrochelatase/peroxidase EfeB
MQPVTVTFPLTLYSGLRGGDAAGDIPRSRGCQGRAVDCAHSQSAAPPSGAHLLGIADLDRRFLRRAYPYFEGIDATGRISCALFSLAVLHDLRKQFEWSVQMWRTNADLVPSTGIAALYGRGVLSDVTGGYFFFPPTAGPAEHGFIGMRIFA